MSKIKKILAVLVTLAMVIAMAVPAFADNLLDIPVSGTGTSAIFKNAQLIQVDRNKQTGWEFVNDNIASAYKSALGVDDNQKAIWKLIKKVSGNTTVEGMPTDIVAASDSQIAAALRSIKNADPSIMTLNAGKTVTAPGVYYIDVEETGYVYNPMTAYVSFTYTKGVPIGLECAGVVAKKEDSDIKKENNNGDAVTEIGREVTYTITSTIPYVSYDNEKSYIITDTISGAAYKLTDNKMMVSVQVGEADARQMEATLAADKKSFTLNLDEYAKKADRGDAGKTLVITYTAIVTDMEVHNHVVTDSGDHRASTDNFLFAGTATLTKTDAATNQPLADATFVVEKKVNDTLKYAKFEEVKENGVVVAYKLSGWTDQKDKATGIVTGDNGTVTVKGLDNSETYLFEEIIAPNGYSVNTTPSSIAWNVTTGSKTIKVGDVDVEYTETIATGSAEMKDSKLNALPSTGGIGTTIFTVGGCLIMIAAAALFFVNRRKATK